MLKVVFAKVKWLPLHLLFLGMIFMGMVALLDNKNTMILTIETDTAQPVEAEFYYTKPGIAFSDDHMSRRYKVKNNQYYFRLPEFDEIAYARLDPTKYKQQLGIKKDIVIILSKWFYTEVYIADIRKSEVGQQIADYKVDNDGIQFKTIGSDAFLNLNLTRKLQYATVNPHIDTFLFAVLIYVVILYLLRVYRTEEMSNFLTAKLILYVLFLSLAMFKVDYYKEHVHFNHPPDIIAHLSYIESLHTHPELFPKFENMSMITNKNAGNYLGHPPLYYYLMNTVYDKNMSVVGNVDNFRTLNTIIFLTSFLLMLYIGFGTKMTLLAHFAYVSLLSSLPMYAYLGSSINNDNLAILGGVVFLIGLRRFLQQKYTNMTYFIVGLGIFLAYFGKFTAALLVFFSILFFFAYLVFQKRTIPINKVQIGILSLFIIPVLIYQLYIYLHYHALVPTLNITHPEEYLHSVYFIPEAMREYKTPLEWLSHYWSHFHSGWFGIHSHHSFVKNSIFQYGGLLLLHIFALIAFFFKCNKDEKAYCVLGKIALLSLFSVAVIQVVFSYNAHLHSGYTGGLQTRYLLPFMASFAIMASVFVDQFRKNYFFTIFVILLCLQALYSDFFYFLKYYL